MKLYIQLTEKQIEAVTCALFEYEQLEVETESGSPIARYYRTVRHSILKQVENEKNRSSKTKPRSSGS